MLVSDLWASLHILFSTSIRSLACNATSSSTGARALSAHPGAPCRLERELLRWGIRLDAEQLERYRDWAREHPLGASGDEKKAKGKKKQR